MDEAAEADSSAEAEGEAEADGEVELPVASAPPTTAPIPSVDQPKVRI